MADRKTGTFGFYTNNTFTFVFLNKNGMIKGCLELMAMDQQPFRRTGRHCCVSDACLRSSEGTKLNVRRVFIIFFFPLGPFWNFSSGEIVKPHVTFDATVLPQWLGRLNTLEAFFWGEPGLVGRGRHPSQLGWCIPAGSTLHCYQLISLDDRVHRSWLLLSLYMNVWVIFPVSHRFVRFLRFSLRWTVYQLLGSQSSLTSWSVKKQHFLCSM